MSSSTPTPESVEQAMRHALSLSEHGPVTGVNPRVGCVLIDATGTIVAEGWHRGAGTAHAEVDALSKLAPHEAQGLTAVVTLEPCNHTGRTGPCSEALIEAGVRAVVFGVDDPGQNSAGGADRLRAAGVEVTSGVLLPETTALLHRWLTATRRRRPYVTAKWASSLDGRVAAADGSSRWITGAAARQHVHEQRAANDAIMVGTGTVIADDPSLTARGDAGEFLARQPLPVVVGHRAVPADAALHRHPRGFVESGSRDLAVVLDELYDRDIRSVFVEGGPTVISELIRLDLVDEYLVYLAPTLLGGPRTALNDLGVGSIGAARRLTVVETATLGDDLVIVARDTSGSPR